jgi:hypothetical protein
MAYFATAAGLPTGLQYTQGSFGPFASGLKSVITRLVNQGLIEEEQRGRMFRIRPGQTFGDARQLARDELEKWNAVVEKVADLFLRMRTQDAEIAASVHFAAHRLPRDGETPTELDVREAVLGWKMRRNPPMNPHAVEQAIRHLNLLSWLDVVPSPELDQQDEELALA